MIHKLMNYMILLILNNEFFMDFIKQNLQM